MILQALRAELLKLSLNRWSLFWAFGFVPIFKLLSGIGLNLFVRTSFRGVAIPNIAAPLASTLDGLSAYGNLFLELFAISGAAILFAGEYRWETWRAILPRNSRTAILIAKLVVFAICAVVSILLCGLAGVLVGLIDMGMKDAIVIWPKAGAGGILTALALGFAATLLQLMAAAGLVMLVAVFSRAMIASIIAPFIILVAAEIAATLLRIPDTDLIGAGLPSTAGRAIRELARANLGNPDAYGLNLALPGAAALALWSIALSVAAMVMFRRQDLSKE
jgi:ABC-2 type transport system permease protein